MGAHRRKAMLAPAWHSISYLSSLIPYPLLCVSVSLWFSLQSYFTSSYGSATGLLLSSATRASHSVSAGGGQPGR